MGEVRTANTSERRKGGMLVICLLVVVCAWSVTWGCRSDPPKPNQPPTIICPNVDGSYTAGPRKTTATVTWESPEVSDPEGEIERTKISSGQKSGDSFGEGSHSVTYLVTDKGGLTNYCTFTFVIKVQRCRVVQYIRDGTPMCDGYTYGHECEFRCDDGYRLKGERRISCQIGATWSADTPKCLALKCPELELPDHGLRHVCTNGRKYSSICWLICDEANGYAPVRGQWTKCNKDQIWTNLKMVCQDVEPPTIHNCPAQTVLQTKEPGSEKTEVVWPTITVTDNSGEDIVVTSINSVVSPSGGTFLEGTELVKFAAKDSEGNIAEPCFFIVRVQSVVCDPPKFDDEYLDTPGCIDFQEGTSCALSCYLAITLVGNKYITCKKEKSGGREVRGYWDWGQYDVPAAKKPFCQTHNCTDLRSPNYGAMVCDKWTKGTQCQLQCREDYDVPESASFSTNLYLCSMVTGKWNNNRVPDCTFREYGESIRLPEYYYFEGSCSVAKPEIKLNFLDAITESDACPESKFCKVENVIVRCGDEPDDNFLGDIEDFRKKRSALRPRHRGSRRRVGGRRRGSRRRQNKTQYISFSIVVPSEKSDSFAESLKYQSRILKGIAKRIARTKFQAGGRLIQATAVRVRDAVPICRPGLKIGFFHRDSCVPCLEGSYHNVSRDECLACPLGQYQAKQGQMTCDQCPKGQTTLTLANIDKSACQEMCLPGYYSKNGVVPCAKCPRGTFQMQLNATMCQRCPVGMTTETNGANSRSQCIPYDMLLQGPVSVPVEGNSPSQICDFTFAVWIKLVETTYDGVKFEIYSPITGAGLEVAISSHINIYIGKKHHVHISDVVRSKWVHVAAVWSQQKMTVFIGGTIIHSQVLSEAPKCPSPASSVMRVAIRDHAYMYLRDLNFLTEAQPNSIKALSMTCSSYLEKSLFTLEQMEMQTLSRVNEVIPSTCLRPDICSTRPCGKNVCIPRGDSFKCACRGGYSGDKCEIPPNLCKDNICRNNATCIISGSNYKCECRPGFRGKLCEDRIADGGWSDWMQWSGCSTSCGKGTRTRHRFCTNPPPDREGKDCKGRKKENVACQQQPCPDCDVSTLIVGKGIIPLCETKGESILCRVECEMGKVFPEKPFNYTCNVGIWTPTRQTVSCTDPVTPLTTGINYTVVFDNPITSHNQVSTMLQTVGSSFQCAVAGECSIHVGSSACSDLVNVCDQHHGDYYGSLIVEKEVPTGQIDILKLQQNKKVNAYLSPLFDTWNVFTHTSEEVTTPEHRTLEMSIENQQLIVFPFDQPELAIGVPGQFGEIMKTWKNLDDTNWEVRNESYTDFHVVVGNQKMKTPNFLSAKQIMTCPPGSVPGGVFCMKCPPGKMYVDDQCSRCRHGFYQNEAGMSSCKSCPGFQTTELLGSPTQAQCKESRLSEMKMLLGLSRPGFGIFDLQTLKYKTVTLEMTVGNVDHLTYNPRDDFVYFATQSPPTIGRIGMDSKNEDILFELPSDTLVTGIDVDVGSGLLFYTTHSGLLATLHVPSSAQHILLSNLSKPRDLLLDQNLGIYWVESSSIKHIKYNSKVANTVVRDKYAIWSPILNKQDGKILWQSYKRLRTASLNGSTAQTLATQFTSRFGHTDDYYFHIDADGRLMRVNKDLSVTVSVFSLPNHVVRMQMVNTTDDPLIDNLCSNKRSDCHHGCFPANKTSRQCFCAVDYTLQKDLKKCRSDFSATLDTSDRKVWRKPLSSDYSVPPSMTLRFNVKACHSARLALAENGRRLYHVELGQKRGNVTEMSIKKLSTVGPPIVLVTNEINLLECDIFKTFWITWKEKILRIGAGGHVGKRQMLVAADFRPYTVNYVMFGTGFNTTATWQF